LQFNTKIIGTGDRYGRADCLTNEGPPMIEFYDPRYQHGPLGQFVSRYYVMPIRGTIDDLPSKPTMTY